MHLNRLKREFDCEGIDIDAGLLEIARERNPQIAFHEGDMALFNIGKRYDAVTCLFSAIGYCQGVEMLNSAIASMGRHLKPGGVLVVEPWITPENFKAGHLGALLVDRDDLKVARFNRSKVEGNRCVLDFHYLIGTHEGIHYEMEEHHTTLFTDGEYLEAFRAAGLSAERDAEGLTGRGLYLGVAS
jgi:SAM-dependent methyltransferase